MRSENIPRNESRSLAAKLASYTPHSCLVPADAVSRGQPPFLGISHSPTLGNGRDALTHRQMEDLEQRQLGKILKKLEAAASEDTVHILQGCRPSVRLVASQDDTQRPLD